MPTIHEVGPYSFVFFSSDQSEPPHVHVKRDRQIAKFWLEPVSLVTNRGFNRRELNQIERLVVEHRTLLLEAWNDYFSS